MATPRKNKLEALLVEHGLESVLGDLAELYQERLAIMIEVGTFGVKTLTGMSAVKTLTGMSAVSMALKYAQAVAKNFDT